ncbi:hypothetical protein Ddye_008251 [Dipteronia dyeriana]|uniref:Uncharacterized protein n=1 Tax=Dipteronia dyeriana TaxID=168575 RepID=A0AAD9X9B1_9ROSI|nr:hypothetical protein Ddye_008251 [Dipteronia dyeriana]
MTKYGRTVNKNKDNASSDNTSNQEDGISGCNGTPVILRISNQEAIISNNNGMLLKNERDRRSSSYDCTSNWNCNCAQGTNKYFQWRSNGFGEFRSSRNETCHDSFDRPIKIALGAKVKLRFINGRCVMPEEDSTDYVQWIQNSGCNWKRGLVNLMDHRCSRSKEKKVLLLSEVSQSVVKYFTKLKKLWDELVCVQPIPQYTCKNCTCGVAKNISNLVGSNRLMQFLIGLNEGFDHVRNQILMIELLPLVNTAYSMILRVG